jgi:hypothetical protein
MKATLTPEGREDLAFALLLLKDFKSKGRFDPDITIQIIGLAKALGVSAEYDKLLTVIPPMRIEPR